MERHQYSFTVMNVYTGDYTRKSFWGCGVTEEECRKDALRQANTYADQKSDDTYRNACIFRRRGYLPSRSSYEFQVVGCSLWK